MPLYEYRCADCREVFGIERTMSESSNPANCESCGSSSTNRIWNAFIRSGGVTPDVGQGSSKSSSGGGGGGHGGCGSCSGGTCC